MTLSCAQVLLDDTLIRGSASFFFFSVFSFRFQYVRHRSDRVVRLEWFI